MCIRDRYQRRVREHSKLVCLGSGVEEAGAITTVARVAKIGLPSHPPRRREVADQPKSSQRLRPEQMLGLTHRACDHDARLSGSKHTRESEQAHTRTELAWEVHHVCSQERNSQQPHVRW
eukprot:TRINITY_DN50159_c0_g1_i1.p4 TRINITY_DN50159_c0_g1~~TRINITY_DN50159_c0_g1_i1.p4  ORF type:complete len:120 (-),score=17.09 TRINITY_DN50159_c0_g1_i1:333-692(-)